jgi:hypothetical protein
MLDAEQKMKLLISDRPWEHEPDHEEWVHDLTGYKCTIWRHPTHGSLNGYVAIPKGHRCHGSNYDWFNDRDVEVHGGLTYSELDKETGEWVVGFDCNHANDFAPKMVALIFKYSSDADAERELENHGKYKDWAYVKEEVCSLARQLKMLDMKQGETK